MLSASLRLLSRGRWIGRSPTRFVANASPLYASRYKAYFADDGIVSINNEKVRTHAWRVEGVGTGFAKSLKLAKLAVAAHVRGRKLKSEIVPLVLDRP